VDRLDRVSHKYSLLINVNKTKVMASDGIACRVFIQNEQLEQVDTFSYLGFLITEDGEGTLKMRDMKLRDMKMRHHVTGVENARHESAAPECKGGKCET